MVAALSSAISRESGQSIKKLAREDKINKRVNTTKVETKTNLRLNTGELSPKSRTQKEAYRDTKKG